MLVLCYQKFFYNILSLTKSLPSMFNFSNITFIAHLFYKSCNVQLYQINYFRCYRGNRVSQFSWFFLFILCSQCWGIAKSRDPIGWLYFFQCFFRENNGKIWNLFNFYSNETEQIFPVTYHNTSHAHARKLFLSVRSCLWKIFD